MSNKKFKLISIVHIFFIKENKILLLRRFNTGYEDGNYSVPAGHLDGSEEVVEAAIRESSEEAGVSIARDDIDVIGVMHVKQANNERIHFFLVAHKWSGKITNMEPDKCDELEWFNIDDLPTNTIPYVRKAISNYVNKKYYDSFGW